MNQVNIYRIHSCLLFAPYASSKQRPTSRAFLQTWKCDLFTIIFSYTAIDQGLQRTVSPRTGL